MLKGSIEALKKNKLVYTEFSIRPLYENPSTFSDLYQIRYGNNFMLVSIMPGYVAANVELLQGDAIFVNKNLLN